MNKWLDNYAYRVSISVSVFALTFLFIFIITLITISFQSIKAAITDSAISLHAEGERVKKIE